MNCIDEDPLDVACRFKWVDDSTIHIINREGIERYMQITPDNQLVEINFNIIPLY